MTDDTNTAQTNTDADENSATNAGTGTDAGQQTTDQQQDQNSQSAAGDGNQDDGNKDGDGKKEGEDSDGEALTGAPESYADFAFPEGSEIDQAELSQFHDIAKELDLSQAGAQKLIEFDIERQAHAFEAIMDAHNRQQEDWISAGKEDKEIGGANYDKALATANAAYKEYGDDEFSNLLKPYDPENNPTGLGLGNNPAFLRVFNRIGLAISEDNPGDTGSTGASEKRMADKFYG